jgi:superfamily I DNA/RNA helicase
MRIVINNMYDLKSVKDVKNYLSLCTNDNLENEFYSLSNQNWTDSISDTYKTLVENELVSRGYEFGTRLIKPMEEIK